jgi:hypothetical protein
MLDALLAKIRSHERAEKLEAFGALGDYLEQAEWDPFEVAPVLALLVGVATSNADDELKEAALDDLRIALARGFDVRVSLAPLVAKLDALSPPLLAIALTIFGRAKGADYRALIAGHLAHDSELVREAAGDALAELDAR